MFQLFIIKIVQIQLIHVCCTRIIIVVFCQWLALLIMKCPYFPSGSFPCSEVYFAWHNTAVPASLCFVYAWYTFSSYFTFNLSLSLCLKYVSYEQPCFSVFSGNAWILHPALSIGMAGFYVGFLIFVLFMSMLVCWACRNKAPEGG